MRGVEQAGQPKREGSGRGDWREIGRKRSAVHCQRQGSPRVRACASAGWSPMACGCARRKKSHGQSSIAATSKTEPSVDTELPCSQSVRRIQRAFPPSGRTSRANGDGGRVRVRGAIPGGANRPSSAGASRGVARAPNATASQDNRSHRTRTTRSIPAAARTPGSSAARPRPTRDDDRRRTMRAPAPRRSAADAAAEAGVRRSRLRAAA